MNLFHITNILILATAMAGLFIICLGVLANEALKGKEFPDS